MADLIDRKTALDAIKQTVWLTKDAKEVLQEAIEKLPSAERHGKWLEHKDYPGLAYLCSKCNWFTTDRSFYCPHCGARMDGE